MLTTAALNDVAPKPGVSVNYEFMPTTKIIDVIEEQGFVVNRCKQSKSRTIEGTPYAKHIVTFRKAGQEAMYTDKIFPEIVVINSHNRGAALRFMTGFFRMVCENGIVTGDIMNDTNKIYHTNRNPFGLVLDRIQRGVHDIDKKLDIIRRMKEIPMRPNEIEDYAWAASKLQVFKNKAFDNPVVLTHTNRYDDADPTLWNVYNTVQENLKKGMVNLVNPLTAKLRKARPIRSIDNDIKYNEQLWNMTVNDYVDEYVGV